MPNDDMKTKDERVFNSPPIGSSIGAMSDESLAKFYSNPAPSGLPAFEAKLRARATEVPTTLSGTAAVNGLQAGDSVYHKVKKKEGSVIRVEANGVVVVRFDKGDARCLQNNLAKL